MLIGPRWFILLLFFTYSNQVLTVERKHHNTIKPKEKTNAPPHLVCEEESLNSGVNVVTASGNVSTNLRRSLVPDSNHRPRRFAAEFPSAGSVCLCPLSSAREARTQWAGGAPDIVVMVLCRVMTPLVDLLSLPLQPLQTVSHFGLCFSSARH